MANRPNLTGRMAAILLTAMLSPVLAACSGAGGSTPTQAAPVGGATPSSAEVAGGGAAGGGATGGGDVCKSIPQADVQALLAFPITGTADNSAYFSCGYKFAGGTTSLALDWNPSDADLSSYGTLKGNGDHAISGFGDMAFWNEAITDHSAPSLVAHKGVATCTMMANDPPDVTMKTTPASGIYQYTVADSDALAYVQLMGKVCNDIFGAL